MSRYSHEKEQVTFDYYSTNITKKSSALQTYYEYNGCYPDDFEAHDDLTHYHVVIN